VELDPLERKLAVPYPHDHAVGGVGGHLEALGKRLRLYDERVITGRNERVLQAGKHPS
jgi:hypothetical protein